MKKRYRIDNIKDIKDRPIFFDANVIIYLFWAVRSKHRFSETYAPLFSTLLKQGNQLFLDTHIISEVINVSLRTSIEFQAYKSRGGNDFKQFRDTEDGQKAQEDVFTIVKEKILQIFSLVNGTINNEELSRLLTVDKLDFNDKLIVDECRKNNMVLLTNDKDFADSDIEILSAHPYFFMH